MIQRLLLVMAGALLVLSASGCVHTPAFKDERGNVIPGSIASMEMLSLGGIQQSVWLRGLSTDNPILILLHGGPGASESALFRHYNGALEEHFLVVYWEQRGTGRSFHSDIPVETMTVEQFVADLDELVAHLTRRFDQDEVILLGHSWGTVPGTIYAARYPENVAAYVGVAQIADMPQSDRLSYHLALRAATLREDSNGISALEAIGAPPYASHEERLETGRWVERYGGMYHRDFSTGQLIGAALRARETSPMDLIRFGRGNLFSLQHLEDEHANIRLARDYQVFDVPVFFLLGSHDWHIPSSLAAEYFASLEAPCKRLFWFRESAHNPPFEEAEKFNEVLITEVKSRLAPDGGHC